MKPNRNDPCLCGSGKKFKKCCALNGSKPMKASIIQSGTKLSNLFQKGVSKELGENSSEISLKEKIQSKVGV